MNPLLERIYDTGWVEDADGNRVCPFPSGISRASSALLYDLVYGQGLRRTLEVGLGHGLSALSICQAHRDRGSGSHTAMDPNQHAGFRSIGLLNLKRAGLDGIVRFYPAPSCDVLPQLCLSGERFDMAFIDGSHLFDYVLVDFFYVDRMLDVGGYVAFDDLWMPAVRRVAGYVLSNRSYRRVRRPSHLPLWRQAAGIGRRWLTDPLPGNWRVKMVPGNVGVLQKTAQDHRPWNWHRRF